MKKVMTYWLAILILVLVSVFSSCGAGVTETGNPTTGNTDGTDTGDNSGDDDADTGDSGDSVGNDDSDGASAADEEEACLDEGGEFAEFSDGCVDLCGTDVDSTCTAVITESCDCGEGFCWNADTFECEEDL